MGKQNKSTIYGSIQGARVGEIFVNRRALHDTNIHRGLMRRIAPGGASIILSGGYVDDIDEGNLIIYTGEGGRDANSGKQVADQSFTGGNLALANNCRDGSPIRVTRGHKLASPYAPKYGYRYDGLYIIDSYAQKPGLNIFLIWRYRLIRLEGQPPLRAVRL